MTKQNISNSKKQQLLDIPIERVAERLGISVTRHHALCFMHDDHHPSLFFFPSTNRWRCYVCDVWGDNISLVMKFNNQSFLEACSWLAKNFGIDIDAVDDVLPIVHNRPLPTFKPKMVLFPIWKYYNSLLTILA